MNHDTTRPIARVALALAVALSVAACTSAGSAPPPAAPSGSPEPQPTTIATGPGHEFYLRVWQTQALPPQYTVGWLPQATIADGWFYDGMIVVPAIYPGPIYTGISRRSISDAGIAAIVAEAQDAGLLGETRSFGQTLPGGMVCHVSIVVAGVTHELAGACAGDDPLASAGPGSAQAFGDFVSKMQYAGTWLAPYLGDSKAWDPGSLVVLASPPTAAETSGPLAPGKATWPLAVPFSRFGKAAGSADIRCAVVSGGDLAALLPAIENGNALTRYTDADGVSKSLQARPLLPGEPAPC
jgi:hypothetical protein